MGLRREARVSVDITDEKIVALKEVAEKLELAAEALSKQAKAALKAAEQLQKATARAEAAGRLPLPRRS